MTKQGLKPRSCSLRKTVPIGPIIGCEEDCLAFDECVIISKMDIEDGMNKVVGPYTPRKEIIVNSNRNCVYCHKKIAKPGTPFYCFKGMFVIHLKFKHPEAYDLYKKGEVDFKDLFY